MKTFLFFFILILCFFTFTTAIYSDGFYYNDADFLHNELYVTPILHIKKDLDLENEKYSLSYEEEEISGLEEPVLGENVFWDDHVVEVDGGVRRKIGVNDRVLVAPHTQVGLSALLNNSSGHELISDSWIIFLSKSDKSEDWNNFGFNYSSGSVSFNFAGERIELVGSRHNPFVGETFEIAEDELSTYDLETFDILQPLEVVNYEYNFLFNNEGDLLVEIENEVKNNFGGELKGVEYSHYDYSLERDFSSEEVFVYEYELNFGLDFGIGTNIFEGFNISVPKYSECIARGSLLGDDNFDPDTRIMSLRRDDCNSHLGWMRRISDLDFYPEGRTMCIDLIPHSIIGQELRHNISENVYDDIVVSFVKDSKEDFFLGEDLSFEFVIENRGKSSLKDLIIEVDYPEEFQSLNSSSCEFENNIVIVSELLRGDSKNCELIFEIEEDKEFLLLKHDLIFADNISDTKSFKYYPDFEFDLYYEGDDFLFESHYEDIDVLKREDWDIEGYDFCQRFSALGLYRIICPL